MATRSTKTPENYRANLVFGVGDEKTSITGTMYFYHRNSIFNRDRGYSARPPFLSSNSTPENLQLTYESVVEAGGTPPAVFGPGDVFFGHAPFGSNWKQPSLRLYLWRGPIIAF